MKEEQQIISPIFAHKTVSEEESEPQNVAEEEAYLKSHMLGYYSVEVEAYDTLQDPQGKHIPRFQSAVTVPTSFFALDHEFSKYANSPGILIQYIS